MSENWLHSFLIDAVQRNLCTRINCSSCGCMALKFRRGVLHALAEAAGQQPSPLHHRESNVCITKALAEVSPSRTGMRRVEGAARCLVFSICQVIGESEAERILGESWGGDVLRRMQKHYREEVAASRAREEYESPASVRKRREEKQRITQEKHHQRLDRKAERDRVWRELARTVDGQTDAG